MCVSVHVCMRACACVLSEEVRRWVLDLLELELQELGATYIGAVKQTLGCFGRAGSTPSTELCAPLVPQKFKNRFF